MWKDLTITSLKLLKHLHFDIILLPCALICDWIVNGKDLSLLNISALKHLFNNGILLILWLLKVPSCNHFNEEMETVQSTTTELVKAKPSQCLSNRPISQGTQLFFFHQKVHLPATLL